MSEFTNKFSSGRSGSALAVHLQTGCRQDRIVKIEQSGAVYIELTWKGSAETANLALINFLADLLQVESKQIEVLAGLELNKKLVSILDVHPEALQNQINQFLNR
jgi:uncharacterized protein YggU (UPF0235/DUF167 family)